MQWQQILGTHHLRVNGHLGEAFAFAPEKGVGLITEQSLPYPSWRNPQQVAVPQSPHALFLRTMDHAEHLQQQLETWRNGTGQDRVGKK